VVYQAQVQSKLFTYGELSLAYAEWGTGPHFLLAFHGFGRSHADFIRFTRPYSSVFRVFAFDIFFHGESGTGKRIPDKSPLEKNELRNLILEFLHQKGIDRTYLMGYSLGGRICMVIAEVLSERVSGMYLFAPDGLIVNRWYGLLSHYALGRSLFRFFKSHNGFFFSLLNGLHQSRVISSRVKEFVASQIETPEMQETVYNVWTFLRKIEPEFDVLGRNLKGEKITVDLFFGLYDKIIPEKNAKKFKKAYPPVKIHVLRSGHILLTAANGELIRKEGLLQLPGNKKATE